MVMMFCVSVPVLSDQNRSIPASSPIDANRDTVACFSAKALDPKATDEVHDLHDDDY